MSTVPKLSEKELVVKFNTYKQELTKLSSQILEIESELEEHNLVAETIKPLNDDRKIYRSIGGVLVEGTLKETIPPLMYNLEKLQTLLDTLVKTYKTKEAEFKKFQLDYKVRIAPA